MIAEVVKRVKRDLIAEGWQQVPTKCRSFWDAVRGIPPFNEYHKDGEWIRLSYRDNTIVHFATIDASNDDLEQYVAGLWDGHYARMVRP